MASLTYERSDQDGSTKRVEVPLSPTGDPRWTTELLTLVMASVGYHLPDPDPDPEPQPVET